MSPETIFVLFEGLLVFGGAVAFAVWQLRSIKKDQEKARAAAAQAQRDTASEKTPTDRA